MRAYIIFWYFLFISFFTGKSQFGEHKCRGISGLSITWKSKERQTVIRNFGTALASCSNYSTHLHTAHLHVHQLDSPCRIIRQQADSSGHSKFWEHHSRGVLEMLKSALWISSRCFFNQVMPFNFSIIDIAWLEPPLHKCYIHFLWCFSLM